MASLALFTVAEACSDYCCQGDGMHYYKQDLDIAPDSDVEGSQQHSSKRPRMYIESKSMYFNFDPKCVQSKRTEQEVQALAQVRAVDAKRGNADEHEDDDDVEDLYQPQ